MGKNGFPPSGQEERMAAVTHVKMDYLKHPAGLTRWPQLSWVIRDEGERDCEQTAYEIQVCFAHDEETIIYDTGKTDSSASAHVFLDPKGLRLEPARAYAVRVRVWTKGSLGICTSAYCPWETFITGLTDDFLSMGDFISAETPEDHEKFNATLIRGEFFVDGEVEEAYGYTTALGLYKYYLNGQKVGTDEMAPGWTSYHKRLCYQTWDIKPWLRQGSNALGTMVGAGWYKGKMGFLERINNYGGQTAFFAHLVIRYKDGRIQHVCTDETFKGWDSPVVFADIYDGEIYDARLEQDGWCLPGFNNHIWRPVQTISLDKTILVSQPGCRVTMMDAIPAKKLWTTPAGDLVVDFGQNMAGWIQILARGYEGAVFELNCFEVLDAHGNVYTDNLRGARQTIRYICRDDKEFIWHPSFTFQGFRYAKIACFGASEDGVPSHMEIVPEIKNFTAFSLHSDMEVTGDFSCSDPRLNQLQHNILWSMKSNFLDIPTDCPQRNERVGWTGDAQIFCPTATYLMNTYTFFSKWLLDVAADQTKEGGVPHIVPDIISGHEHTDWLLSQGTHSAAAWADVAVLNPWHLYLAFGDKEILKQQYDSMKRWINFMRDHSKDNIWNYRLQFGDWVALDAKEGSYFGATPNDLTCTAYYAHSTEIFARIAGILGRQDDHEAYMALYHTIKKTFQDRFFKPDGAMTVQTQTAHIIALYFNLVPEKHRAKVSADLVKLLKKENGHLVTGFVGTPYFCHALSENGYVKEAYDLLLKEDFPSWLYQVNMGATTIWEHWDGIRPDGSMWSPDMNSFNHYAYGAVGLWMYTVLAGLSIDEDHPGYKQFMVYPRPGAALTWAKTSYDSIYGKISVTWKLQDHPNAPGQKRLILTVDVPANTKALIRLYQCEKIIKNDGIAFENAGNEPQGMAGSGTYEIIYDMRQATKGHAGCASAGKKLMFFEKNLCPAKPVECRTGSSYFWRDGQVFFWLGDTAWLMFHELTREEIDDYLMNRTQKGFNVIQTVCVHHFPVCTKAGRNAFIENDVTQPDTDGEDSYWALADWTVERARQLGLYLALVPHWGNLAPRFTKEEMEGYIDFLTKRYKDCDNILWLTGGDVRGDEDASYWQTMGRRIKQNCPRQLVSFHPFGRTSSADFFPNDPWMDFHMFQSGHRTYDQVFLDSWDDKMPAASDEKNIYYGEDNWRYVADGRQLKRTMPILDGEPSYEHIPQGLHVASQPYWTPAQVRRYGWWSVLAGAAGFTYGHNSIMQFYPGYGQGAFFVRYPWKDAIHGPAGMSAAAMGRFMQKLFDQGVRDALAQGADPAAWIQENFKPCPDILRGDSRWSQKQREDRIMAYQAGTIRLCYTWTGRPICLTIPGPCEAWWMDPVCGALSRIGTVKASGTYTFAPPAGDFDHKDWLLVLG